MLKKLSLISAVALLFPTIAAANSFVIRLQLTVPETLQVKLDRSESREYSKAVTSTETVKRNGKTVTLNSIVSR